MRLTETPLVYTTRGNLPQSELVFTTAWVDQPDFTRLTETYTAADGEIVRQDVHVFSRKAFDPVGLSQAAI